MEVFKAIETRRSIRKYKDRPIPDDLLRQILEAARLAPSASNRQPWALVVVREREQKRLASKACSNMEHVAGCAAFIACFSSPKDKWYQVDAAIALENISLAAWEAGIGSCWIGYFDEDYMKSVLHIPQDDKIVACMTLGYPDETPDARPRKELADLVYWEKFIPRASSPPF
ncbi:nitroreductase family protein [Methanocella sp. MCL-LM]|uniref:nitroreductase family protein n=1 Tax=Methanocella sp. MCL-LM TaxID=3412035 RepID=UPI003C74DBDB